MALMRVMKAALGVSLFAFAEFAFLPWAERAEFECVLSGQHGEVDMINWAKVSSRKEFESCMLRGARTSHDIPHFVNWLEYNGISAVGPFDVQEVIMMREYGLKSPGSMVTGSLGKDRIPFRLGVLNRIFVHGASFGITFDANGNPLDLHLTLTRE